MTPPGPATGQQRPSVNDVATLAGVSLGTVSNVLNRPERVTEATRARVERAIEMLGYVPNAAARSLKLGTAATIGLIVGDLTNSLFVDIARGAEGGAEDGRLHLMLANSDTRIDREQSYLSVFAQARVTGILMTLNDEAHFRTIAASAPRSIPLIVLNYTAPTSQFCSVNVDNELGGYLAGRHLVETGRKHLVYVGGPSQLQAVVDRGRGFARAVDESPGVTMTTMTPDWINRADGWAIGRTLSAQVEAGEVDGIFAASDLLAAGIVQALSVSPQIRIPHDVAVVGYDNNQAAWDSPIPISTIAQPGEDLGRLAALLVQEEAAESPGHTHEHVAVVLPPRLIERQSSAPQP